MFTILFLRLKYSSIFNKKGKLQTTYRFHCKQQEGGLLFLEKELSSSSNGNLASYLEDEQSRISFSASRNSDFASNNETHERSSVGATASFSAPNSSGSAAFLTPSGSSGKKKRTSGLLAKLSGGKQKTTQEISRHQNVIQ